MENLLMQGPNWVDQLGVIVMATIMVFSEILTVLICGWALAEIGLAIYERLHHRIMRLSL